MVTTSTLMLAVGFALAVAGFEARAVPASSATSAVQRNDVTLVKQDCPKGYHWSYRMRQCIRDW